MEQHKFDTKYYCRILGVNLNAEPAVMKAAYSILVRKRPPTIVQPQPQQSCRPLPCRQEPAKHGILPWPTYEWQRIALFCSFLLAFILILLSHIVWLIIAGTLLSLISSYAAIKTHGLTAIPQNSFKTKLAAGFSVIISLCIFGMAALLVGLAIGAICGIVLAGVKIFQRL